MADKKISALPAATTPLAGTEVLPIVQSSTTDQVSVANLTAGRAVSALSVTTTQDVTTGRNIVVTDAGRIEQNGAAGGLYFINTAVSAGATNMRFYTTNASGVAQLQFQLIGGSTPANSIYGNLIAETGNLVIGTAGKGIDFSANTHAAGMTSELLNWYEEGSFTATAVPDTGTITLSTNTLRYTRTGRTVHISGTLVVGSVSSPTNNVYIATLPFSAGLACGGGIAIDDTNAFAGQVGWFINAGQQSLYIYYRDATGAYVASAPIFKAGTVIRIDATYTV